MVKQRMTFLMALLLLLWQVVDITAQSNCAFLTNVTWHPTADQFAFNCDDTVYIYTAEFQLVDTLVAPTEPPELLPRVSDLEWSPNGLYLAAILIKYDALGGDAIVSRLIVWDINSGSIVLDIPDRDSPVNWSPDSTLIAVVGRGIGEDMYFYELSSGNEVGRCDECGNAIGAEWNPVDTNRFIASNAAGTLFVDPLAISNPTNFVEDILISEYSDSYSTDGSQIVFYNLEARQLEVRDADTLQIIAALPFTSIGALGSYHWLADGIYIDANPVALRWDGISSQPVTLPIDERRIIWKPDGSTYISAITREGLFVYDTLTGNVKAQFLFDAVSQVSSFAAFDVNTSQTIPDHSPLIQGATIDIGQIGITDFGIRANINPDTVGSVVFDLNGTPSVQTDDTAPYDLTDWTPAVGEYTLTATPYSEANGEGTTGIPMTVTFTIVERG